MTRMLLRTFGWIFGAAILVAIHNWWFAVPVKSDLTGVLDAVVVIVISLPLAMLFRWFLEPFLS